jgi:hypothetical protein
MSGADDWVTPPPARGGKDDWVKSGAPLDVVWSDGPRGPEGEINITVEGKREPGSAQEKPPRSLLDQAKRVPGRAARAAIQGAGNLLSLPHNVTAAALNAPAHAYQIGDWAADRLGLPTIGNIRAPIEYGAPARWARELSDYLGLPEPENAGERIGDRMAEEIAGAGFAGLGARTLVRGLEGALASRPAAPASTSLSVARAFDAGQDTQAASAMGAGYLGGEAAEATDNPYVQMGAAMLGGLGVGAAVHAPGAGAVAKAAVGAAGAPFTEAGRTQIVGRALRDRAVDAPSMMARLRAWLDAGGPQLVPGSAPTTAEVGRDVGLLQGERALRQGAGLSGDTAKMGHFSALDIARTEARRRALEAEMPVGPVMPDAPAPGAADVADAVRGQVAKGDKAMLRAEEAAANDVQGAEAGLPPSIDRAGAGSTMRDALAEGHDAAKQRTSVPYMALREAGPVAPIAPLRATAAELEAMFPGGISADAPPELRVVLARILEYPGDYAPFGQLQALLAETRDAAGDAARSNRGGLAKAYGRLHQSVMNAMDQAADEVIPAGRPITQGDIARGEAAEAAGQNPDLARALETAPRGVSAAERRAAASAEKSLVQFLVERGGVRDVGGELASMDARHARPGLISGRGMSLDRAVEAAREAGYFDDIGRPSYRAEADNLMGVLSGAGRGMDSVGQAELLAAIDDELRGLRRRYAGDARMREDQAGREAMLNDLGGEVARRGGSLSADPAETLRSIREPAGPDDYGNLPQPETPVLPPPENAMTPEQVALLREGQKLRRDQGETFERGAVGRVLNKDTLSNYTAPESAVPQMIWKPGPGGVEAVQQFLRGVGDGPTAVEALTRYAAQSLRDAATNPATGQLVPAKIARWLRDHREVLAEFPDLRDRMSNLRSATAQLDWVLGFNQATRRELENGVARAFLQREPVAAVREVFSSTSQERGMRALLDMVGNDPAARAGLQQAYIDALVEGTATSGTLPNAAGEAVEALSGAKLRQMLQNTRGAASQLFSPAQMRRLEAVVEDFQSGTQWQRAGAGGGSPTAQNLAMANLFGRATMGLVDTSRSGAAIANNAVTKALSMLYKLAAPEIERLLLQAALDPKEGLRMMQAATPTNAEQFMRWAMQNGAMPVREALAAATARSAVRTNNAIAHQDAQAADGGFEEPVAERADGGDVEPDSDVRLGAGLGRHRPFRIETYDERVPETANPPTPAREDSVANPNLLRQGERIRAGRPQAPWPDRGVLGDAMILGSGGGAGMLGKATMNLAGQAASTAGGGLLGPQGVADVVTDAALALPGAVPVRAAIAGLGMALSPSDAEAGRFDRALRAFHGSPHVFDRFSLGHINTGEGAQAYGRGLYFTENEGIAEGYRRNLLARHGRDSEAPYRIVFDDLGERALSRLSPDAVWNLRHPFPDLATLDEFMLGMDGVPENITRHNYHTPEVRGVASELASHHLEQLGKPYLRGDFLNNARMLRESGQSPRSAQDSLAALRTLRSRPYTVEPNLGAQYEVAVRADPDQFLNLEAGLDRWNQSGQVLRGLDRLSEMGPNVDRALGEWGRFSDPRVRITNLQNSYALDRAGRPWHDMVDTQGMSSNNRIFMDDLIKEGGSVSEARQFVQKILDHMISNGAHNKPRVQADIDETADLLRRLRAAENAPSSDGMPAHLSDTLRDLGIVGSRYRDASSRRAASTPTHNLVLFDDKPIEVLRRYAQGGLAA